MVNEKKLITKILKGDNLSSRKLIEIYYDEILNYIYSRVFDKNEAEDITQEVFLGMLLTIKGYDSKKSSFKTYLYQITKYKIIDHIRKITPLKEFEFLNLDDNHDKIPLNYKEDNLFFEIEEYLKSSNSKYLELFYLKFIKDLTFKEISLLKGISESTIKTRYYKMIKTIRKEFFHE